MFVGSTERVTDQRGESLVESLVAIAILAMVALVAFTGLRTAIDSTSRHRERAALEAMVRSAAESIQAAPFASCAESPASRYASVAPIPSGYTLALDVWFASVPIAPLGEALILSDSSFSSSCSPGSTLHRVLVEVTDSEGASEQLLVIKRGAPDASP